VRLNLDREWFAERADLEKGLEVTAGRATEDALLAEAARQRGLPSDDGAALALGRLINRKRRESGLAPESLAERSGVDLEVLLSIERGAAIRLEPQTVTRLADVLGLPSSRLMELSGLDVGRHGRFREDASSVSPARGKRSR
jgi:hypothetical protein